MTAPWLVAKKAMKPTSAGSIAAVPSAPNITPAATERHSAIPAAPISSSVLRPSRSISAIPTSVNTRLARPIMIACRSGESEPARAKMSFR